MEESKARAIKIELQQLCKRHGLWLEVSEKYKPEIKDIILTISIRITGKKNN